MTNGLDYIVGTVGMGALALGTESLVGGLGIVEEYLGEAYAWGVVVLLALVGRIEVDVLPEELAQVVARAGGRAGLLVERVFRGAVGCCVDHGVVHTHLRTVDHHIGCQSRVAPFIGCSGIELALVIGDGIAVGGRESIH